MDEEALNFTEEERFGLDWEDDQQDWGGTQQDWNDDQQDEEDDEEDDGEDEEDGEDDGKDDEQDSEDEEQVEEQDDEDMEGLSDKPHVLALHNTTDKALQIIEEGLGEASKLKALHVHIKSPEYLRNY